MRSTKIFISAILTMTIACMALVGCSNDGSSASRQVRDRKAYSLGREHGAKVVELKEDEAALQDMLLDVRARMTNINDRLGTQASIDYERGFVDYVTENCDSLAKVLF